MRSSVDRFMGDTNSIRCITGKVAGVLRFVEAPEHLARGLLKSRTQPPIYKRRGPPRNEERPGHTSVVRPQPFVIVSSRFRITLITDVQAASSASLIDSSRGESPIET